MAEPNEYEQQRNTRIAENRARLEALGLLDHALSGAAEERRRAARQRARQAAAGGDSSGCAPAAVPEPTRRSRRIRGDAVENAGVNMVGPSSAVAEGYACSSGSGSRRPRVQVDIEALVAGGGDPFVDSHNLMRIQTMSEKALRTRIWRINRVDKLHSFVQVLDACGMAELAAEAREALSQLTGGAVTG